ncbi:MAG: hypothetical protein FJ086_09565 [Deltaproteobacteria bacterium]|nr:hypothetical protein [Deltaproteobacteria bacterium]
MSEPLKTGLRELALRLAAAPAWRERLASRGFAPGDLLAASEHADTHATAVRLLAPFPGLTRADLAEDASAWLSPRVDELPQLHPAWSSGSSGQGPLAVPRFDADVAHRQARMWEAAAAGGISAEALCRGAFLCALPGRPEGRAWLDVPRSIPVDRISLCRAGWEDRLRACGADFWNLSPVGLAHALQSHEARPLPPPRVVFSTALVLEDALRRRTEDAFGCPVLDLFSTAETGPFAWGCSAGGAFHVLSGGFLVDVDPEGLRVTRLGDSPLPLLHYRLADHATAALPGCPRCGHAGPTLVGLRGRTRSEKGEHSSAPRPLPAAAG